MFKFRFIPACLIILCLAASGCTSYKDMSDEKAKEYYMTRFEFATTGNANIGAYKQLTIDGRNWNFAEILASVVQDAMRDRNISVSELLPTKGGEYAREEARLAGRHVEFEFGWAATGKIHYLHWIPTEYANDNLIEVNKQKKNFPQFLNTSRHYETDEEFYEGLKKELRPHIDIILDDTFRRIREGTDFPGFQQ